MHRSKSTHRVGVPHRTLTSDSLNDDSAEKRARREERVANKHLERQKVVAAAATHATPVRSAQHAAPTSPPRTPNGTLLKAVDGASATPIKKVPILANFEEWMKMATDNKINATNSWNFALIDYFHDMSLLRDGDSINFQKASCTLDGCVKIYTSRVDSVASETGKLLSGLSDSQSKRGQEAEEGDGEGGDTEEQREKKARKRAQRAEATLVKDFNAIQLKKFDLEFSVDPLFKKTSADFDEGGAKGLLLNHLNLDKDGRIVFDASDTLLEEDDEDEPSTQEGSLNLDLADLQGQFFPDLSELDELDVCPSLKNYEFTSDKMELPFLKLHSDLPEEEPDEYLLADRTHAGAAPFGDDGGFGDFGGDDGGDFGGDFNAATDADFDKGGENWGDVGGFGDDGGMQEDGQGFEPLKEMGAGPGQFVMALTGEEGENILSYFDERGGKNWAGPEHWRIQRIKKAADSGAPEPKKARKEKEVFEIDFFSVEDPDEEALFATGGASINLPKTQWKSKSRNLLPDDMHFNSKQLLRLFLKPKAMLHAKKSGGANAIRGVGGTDGVPDNVDERYWAEAAQRNKIVTSSSPHLNAFLTVAPEPEAHAGYDADFFADNDTGGFGDGGFGDDGETFADAREQFSPGASRIAGVGDTSQSEEFGSLLRARRARPDYVNYAKTAKKVDVKRLKDNLWAKLDIPETKEEAAPKKFTNVIRELDTVYPEKALADISTSFCFICLLHLANEKGLKIEGNSSLDELSIVRDNTVEGTDSF